MQRKGEEKEIKKREREKKKRKRENRGELNKGEMNCNTELQVVVVPGNTFVSLYTKDYYMNIRKKAYSHSVRAALAMIDCHSLSHYRCLFFHFILFSFCYCSVSFSLI